jgi:hypothetical protein
MDATTVKLAAAASDRNPERDACSFLDAEDLAAGHACRIGAHAGRAPSVVVWGDSHADALMPTFDRLAADRGVQGIYLGRIGCPPLLGVDRPGTDFNCRKFNEAAQEVIARSGARTVVLVARWAHYTSEPTFGSESRTRVVITDGASTMVDVRNNDAVLASGLRRTLEFLGEYQVFVVSSVPEVGYDVPPVLARVRHLGRTLDIRPARRTYDERQLAVQQMFDDAHRRSTFTQLQPDRILCDADHCQVALGDRPLYFDSHHLSTFGANFVARELESVFTTSAARD